MHMVTGQMVPVAKASVGGYGGVGDMLTESALAKMDSWLFAHWGSGALGWNMTPERAVFRP